MAARLHVHRMLYLAAMWVRPPATRSPAPSPTIRTPRSQTRPAHPRAQPLVERMTRTPRQVRIMPISVEQEHRRVDLLMATFTMTCAITPAPWTAEPMVQVDRRRLRPRGCLRPGTGLRARKHDQGPAPRQSASGEHRAHAVVQPLGHHHLSGIRVDFRPFRRPCPSRGDGPQDRSRGLGDEIDERPTSVRANVTRQLHVTAPKNSRQ